MDRRDFLQSVGSLGGVLVSSHPRQLLGAEAGWRTFAVTTRVQILKPSGTTRVWLPAPLIRRTPYQRTLANTVRCENGVARMVVDTNARLAMVIAKFRPGVEPILTVTSRVATRDWTVDLTTRGSAPLGRLQAGFVADIVGAPAATLIGAAVIAGAIAKWWRLRLAEG